MHTSAATPDLPLTRTSRTSRTQRTPQAPRLPRRTHVVVPLVIIDVTVPGTSSANGRRALHAALGDDLRLYVVTIDQQRERVTFRVEVTSRTLEDVIGLLTVKLDRATLGRAQSTVIRRPRDY
ncbi:hypothetical protein [Paraburkholderia phytofirmans]|uniref:Uncharacterized protein n=1 Tax=Paraburkholderia phytofirmans (strain DSM 17436 / LMG 22146 / PsJN) TaxID=398527 RepID=B2T830_PARPJ|nr:hypothetical protein [Paraburkholderia phytofirmans]ACD20298.1 conserved hypothetical protein [Paraburkholderia phytofirmans PsJN]